MSAGRIPELTPESLSPEQKDVLELVAAGRGRIPTPYKIWIHSPELARLLFPLGKFLSGGTSLSKREIEIAILSIAAHWHADYVFTVHAREALEAGLSQRTIDALRKGKVPTFDDNRERCAYDVAAALERSSTPSQAAFDAAVRVLGHAGLAELLALCGYFTSVGLAMKLYAVEPPKT